MKRNLDVARYLLTGSVVVVENRRDMANADGDRLLGDDEDDVYEDDEYEDEDDEDEEDEDDDEDDDELLDEFDDEDEDEDEDEDDVDEADGYDDEYEQIRRRKKVREHVYGPDIAGRVPRRPRNVAAWLLD